MICQHCGKPTLLDAFAGEGGAGEGYRRAGFCVQPVELSKARLDRYPRMCPAATPVRGDAVHYIAKYGRNYAAIHASPTCTGYSAGTRAIPNRVAKYDRLIGAVREALNIAGRPYVIENVEGAKSELHTPILLCGRMFGLAATDDDGTPLVMDRHRLFESNVFLTQPEHAKHDRTLQVAGSYGGARRDKDEARHVRKGGYVPSVDVQRELLGTPWMTEKGCQLSIPPAYTHHIGTQLLDHLAREAS